MRRLSSRASFFSMGPCGMGLGRTKSMTPDMRSPPSGGNRITAPGGENGKPGTERVAARAPRNLRVAEGEGKPRRDSVASIYRNLSRCASIFGRKVPTFSGGRPPWGFLSLSLALRRADATGPWHDFLGRVVGVRKDPTMVPLVPAPIAERGSLR
jgi:hypothetical protein